MCEIENKLVWVVKSATFRQSAGKNVTLAHFTFQDPNCSKTGWNPRPTNEEGREHHAL